MTAPFLRTDRSQGKGEEQGHRWPSKLLVQAGVWSRASQGLSDLDVPHQGGSQRERVSCSMILQIIRMEGGALPEDGIGPGLEG